MKYDFTFPINLLYIKSYIVDKNKRGRMLNIRIKIEGKCPYCNCNDSVVFTNYYHEHSKVPYQVNVPFCNKCWNDEIAVRKINNRRYKIIGKY